MKAQKAIKSFFKVVYTLLKILFAVIVVLVLIIVIIAFYSRYQRVSGIKEYYSHAFQLIEEKYDNKIYLSNHQHNSLLILDFTAKRGFENTYNINDLPQQEFYTLVGHEIFNCFKNEITNEIEYDKAHGTNYFVFPVLITIKYGNSSDEYVDLELYEKDFSEYEMKHEN